MSGKRFGLRFGLETNSAMFFVMHTFETVGLNHIPIPKAISLYYLIFIHSYYVTWIILQLKFTRFFPLATTKFNDNMILLHDLLIYYSPYPRSCS